MNRQTIGQVIYENWCKDIEITPNWQTLPVKTQEAWEHAAENSLIVRFGRNRENNIFTVREAQEIDLDVHYAKGTNHGTSGHLERNIIAKLYNILSDFGYFLNVKAE